MPDKQCCQASKSEVLDKETYVNVEKSPEEDEWEISWALCHFRNTFEQSVPQAAITVQDISQSFGFRSYKDQQARETNR